jgi:mannose-6-phosphate isomerase-like protein (cupin superfamily)
MVYRDLLPEREGGRFIASHITIAEGGPVADYVHHHDVRFQVIHCVRGWVRVVYEDQGEPFTMRAGDTVLQPPHIRHRVLESSPGLEVFELTGPAEHPTYVEHDITLPTDAVRPDRDFGGQRFAHHELATATWRPWRGAGFEAADTGIGDATGGVAATRTVRATGSGSALDATRHDAELVLWFVERGTATLRIGDVTRPLDAGDAVAVPAGVDHALSGCSADLTFYEVTLPA